MRKECEVVDHTEPNVPFLSQYSLSFKTVQKWTKIRNPKMDQVPETDQNHQKSQKLIVFKYQSQFVNPEMDQIPTLDQNLLKDRIQIQNGSKFTNSELQYIKF